MTEKTTVALTPEAWAKKCRAQMRRVETYADLSAAEVDTAIKTLPGMDKAGSDEDVFAIVTAHVETELAAAAAEAEEAPFVTAPAVESAPPAPPAKPESAVVPAAPAGANVPALANLAALAAKFAGQNATEKPQRQPVLNWRNGGQNYQTAEWRRPETLRAIVAGQMPISALDVFGGFVINKRGTFEFPLGKVVERPSQKQQGNGDEVQYLYDLNQGGVVQVCFITHRLDYCRQNEDGTYKTLPHYEDGAKAWFRAWVLVKGAEAWHLENGPLLLSVRKTNAYQFRDLLAIKSGPNKGQAPRQKMLDRGEQVFGVRPPDYFFYLPIAPGEPVLSGKKEQSYINPPVLRLDDLPENPDLALSTLVLSEPMLELCAAKWDELKAWAEEPIVNQIKAIEAWESGGESETAPDAHQESAADVAFGEAPAQTDAKPTKKPMPF